jgi:integration host factor subunit alpha
MTLTKAQIVDTIQQQLKIQRKESYELMEDLLEVIKRGLVSGEDVMISGFGKFCVKEKKVRKGRNPATGKEMMLDARRVVTFHSSGKLRDKLNSK